MKVSLVAGFLAAATVAATSVTASAQMSGGIRWQSNVQSAQRLSQQTHRPLLLVFGASWCTWCRKLEQTTLSDPRLGGYINANFIPVHVDADRDPQLVQTLHADSLPTAVILGPDSNLLGRISGYKDTAGYHAALAMAAGRLAPMAPAIASPETILVQKNVAPSSPGPVPGSYQKIYPTYPQFHLTNRMPSPILLASLPGAVPPNRIPGLVPSNHAGLPIRGVVPTPPKPGLSLRFSPSDLPMHSIQGS